VVFAPGIDREALEICRELLRLVQEENLRFDQIGILIRDYANYGRVLRETLELYGIPFYLAPQKSLSDFSSVRALLSLLQLPEQEYSRRSLIGFLSRHAVKTGDAPARELAGLFDLVSREALIVRGKDEWKERLDPYLAAMIKSLERAKAGMGFSEEDEKNQNRKQALIEKKIQAAEKLREISTGLISELEELKAKKTFSSWSESGQRLCDKYLDLGFEGEPGLKEAVAKIFEEIARLDQAGVPADHQTFMTLVSAGVAGAGVDHGKFHSGGVCVTDLMAARGVRFKAVIVPGLTEGSFPLRLSENPLLADDDRRWINGLCQKAGLPGYLAEKRKLPQEERLLFYLACSQADDFLILTSPWLELESNREKPASYLLTYALERLVKEPFEFDQLSQLAERHAGWIRWVELSGFAPEQEGLALSAEDWEESEIERATDWKELSHLAGGGTRRPIAIAAERWLKEDFGCFTGFPGLDRNYDPRTFSILSQKISPSLLQDFLRCPFEYFLKRVLEVEALSEPEYVWQFDRQAQGNVIHKILEGLFRASKDKGPARTREQFRKDLEQAIAGYGEPFLRAEYPAPEKMAKLELEQIYFYLLKWWRELLPDPEFKETVIERNISQDPVKLELGEGRCVYLRGRIDRIDRSQTRACVNDYKVSKQVKQGGISQLQLPIYMLSVCNLFGYQPEQVEGRFLVMVPEKLGSVEVIRKSGKKLAQHLVQVRDLVNRIADWIERGVFVPSRDDCGSCDFRLGCFATTAVYRKKKRNPLSGEINALIEDIDFAEEADDQ
jgi:ATP-dependent helicase/nuclease subunit B